MATSSEWRGIVPIGGSLTEQWQDELAEKLGLNFEILTGDTIQAARTANPVEHKEPV
jgi:hypothetical protein